jgi:hypothetical protein
MKLLGTADGSSPTETFARSLRTALSPVYPQTAGFEVADTHVSVLERRHDTTARVHACVEVRDGSRLWRSAGAGVEVWAACWDALANAFNFGLSGTAAEGSGVATTTEDPLRGAPRAEDATTLAVTLRPSRRALARIAATLSSVDVLDLRYTVLGVGQAAAEIQVPREASARARARLSRAVDVLAVTDAREAHP